MFLKILTVASLAAFEIYVAIPTGFAFKLSPWIIFFASAFGGLAGIFIVVFLGETIKRLVSGFRKITVVKEVKTDTVAHRIWNKFGIIGLGFLGTLLVGAPICIAVGLGFNAQLNKLIFWCCAGVITRCVIFTLAGHFGSKLFFA